MHCEFMYTTNTFQDESWDYSNFICYEGSRISINDSKITLKNALIHFLKSSILWAAKLKLRLEFLPPYSPNLAQVEMVFGI